MHHQSITETLAHLQRAALELARGFEQAQNKPRSEQGDAMREASAALIEMRRAADDLAQRCKFSR
jgi:predicted mannosyl-3-phosphoglycerate phosphatase (HAD superfamily)